MEKGKLKVEWDYKFPKPQKLYYEQSSWNRTLITKINQISAHRHQYYSKINKRIPDLSLNVPKKFEELITDQEYYDKDTKKYQHILLNSLMLILITSNLMDIKLI